MPFVIAGLPANPVDSQGHTEDHLQQGGGHPRGPALATSPMVCRPLGLVRGETMEDSAR